MDWVLGVLLAATGLGIGSIVDSLVGPVASDRDLRGAMTECSGCGRRVTGRELVPVVGWLGPRSCCGGPSIRNSWSHLTVQISTAVLFVAMGWRFGWSLALPAYLYLVALAVLLSAVDLRVRRLPNRVVLPAYLIGGALLALASVPAAWSEYLTAWLAAVVSFTGYYALALVHPRGMGYGDVKLAGVLGLFLGWLGWPVLMAGVFGGFLLGSVAGLVALAVGRDGRGTRIPFGPFMFAGAILAILWL